MAKPSATVNGKAIYSDKNIASIVNAKVTFTDGSWCDVSTGKVVNKGQGYISLGAPDISDDTERVTTGTKTYCAVRLDVQELEADINIKPIDGKEMTVFMEGAKSCIENIDVRVQSGVLVVRGKDTGGSHKRGSSIVISNGNINIGGMCSGTVITGNGSVIMSGGRNENDMKVTIGVPKGSPVNVSGISGTVTVGDTEGPLVLSLQGQGDDDSVGKVSDAQLSVQGQRELTVKEVNGSLNVNVMGQGEISVRGGRVSMLQASVMGQGDFIFRGKAENANLSVMGQGEINVTHVTNRPMKNIIGQGEITIGNW